MHSAHYFETQLERAKKHFEKDPQFPFHQTICDFFLRCIDLPSAMAQELFDFFNEDHHKLIQLIDLFTQTEAFGFEEAIFDKEDWQEITEQSNRFADEIELGRLESLYQFFLRHHLLNMQE
ncbi:MAG: hypothetical protein ACRCVN_00890 [Spirochaetia bacterium]